MDNIKDYTILVEMDLFKLESKIKQLISEWWQPLWTFVLRKGAVTSFEYLQAMVKIAG